MSKLPMLRSGARRRTGKHVYNLLKIQGFYWREERVSRKDCGGGRAQRKGGPHSVGRLTPARPPGLLSPRPHDILNNVHSAELTPHVQVFLLLLFCASFSF